MNITKSPNKASCGYLVCQTEWNIIFKLWERTQRSRCTKWVSFGAIAATTKVANVISAMYFVTCKLWAIVVTEHGSRNREFRQEPSLLNPDIFCLEIKATQSKMKQKKYKHVLMVIYLGSECFRRTNLFTRCKFQSSNAAVYATEIHDGVIKKRSSSKQWEMHCGCWKAMMA